MNANVHGLLPSEGTTLIQELGLDMNANVHGLVSMSEFFLSFHSGAYANQEFHMEGSLTFEKSFVNSTGHERQCKRAATR